MKFNTYSISELIDEIAMGPFGSNIKVECFVDDGIPVLNGSNLNGFFLTEDSFRYVTEEKADSLGRANAHRGDIVITHRGTLGQIVCIPETSKHDRYVISQSQFRVKCNEKVLPEYLVYYFHTAIGQHKLLSNASQVGVPALARASTTFQKIEVEIPDIKTQQKAVSVLNAIEAKINVNRSINENLEQQARAVFQAWFIDYEPFGGVAPSAWHPATLGQIAELKTDSWSPAKNPDVMVEHYSIPAFDEQHYPVFEIAAGIKSNKYILNSNSVMISKLNPDTKRIWRPLCLSAHSVCSTEFIVYEAKKQEQRDYIYSILDSTPFLNYLCSHTTGSTNSRQRATPKSTLDFTLCLPPDSIIEDFCQIVTPMYDLIASNIVENQSLAKTRDSLLPRLMSGKIDVSTVQI